jgi:hypothetical protein
MKLAIEHHVVTYTLADAQARNWRDVGFLPLLLIDIQALTGRAALLTEDRKFGVRRGDSSGKEIAVGSYQIVQRATRRRMSLPEIIALLWPPVDLDAHGKDTFPRQVEAFTKPGEYSLVDEGAEHPIVVRVRYEVRVSYRYGHVPLATGHRLVDEQSGKLVSEKFETQPIALKAMSEGWPSVPHRGDVPSDPHLIFTLLYAFNEQQPGLNPDELLFTISTEP